MTLPPLESYLNWVTDPMPLPARRPDDLTSPAPSENTPPANASRKLPRRLRPRRCRGKQPAVSANDNSASRIAGLATPLGPSANGNSSRAGSSAATRPRSAANRNLSIPGPQPGTRSALMKHPQTFQSSQHSQHPRSTANRNLEPRFRLDHPDIRGVYKPAHLFSYPEGRRFSQKLFSAVELLCILLCANFGIQAFIFHHTSEPLYLYVEKGQLVIRSSSFSTRAPFSLC